MAGPLDKLFPGMDEGAIARTLSSMTEGQRAMVASRLPLLSPGLNSLTRKPGMLTAEEAADLVQISPTTVKAAVQIRARATAEEIAAVERGEVGVSRLYKRIRTMTPEQRAAYLSVPPEKRGKKEEQIQNARLENKIWKDLRSALEALTGMPAPAAAVAIARKNAQTRAIANEHVDNATLWLMEFADAWNVRGKE